MKKMSFALAAALIGLVISEPSLAGAEEECGLLEWNYGPFDYRTSTHAQRRLVESAHFTPDAEKLKEAPTGSLGGDFKYTLSVFPNHPRALLAMRRLAAKEKRDPPGGAKYSVECWFERALRFKPDDHIPRMLYVGYLIDHNRTEEARKHLDFVAQSTLENPFAQFNVGMFYVDLKDYDKALIQAHRVMAMGFTRPEIKDRLTAVGRWAEPEASPPAAASAAVVAPASSKP